MAGRIIVGTAGWSIPAAVASRFPGGGTHLQRYAAVMPAAEINSSFHRPHRPSTYHKWANSTPIEFRFAIKLPREITHDRRLRGTRTALERFLAESEGLGERRGPLLVQLPPSLEFDARVTARFFELLRSRVDGDIVCEPRHASWFTPVASRQLERFEVARVAADPPPAPGAGDPAGSRRLTYFRLHGSPRKYWSRYDDGFLESLAAGLRLAAQHADAWCIFDNTASGAALQNALEIAAKLKTSGDRSA